MSNRKSLALVPRRDQHKSAKPSFGSRIKHALFPERLENIELDENIDSTPSLVSDAAAAGLFDLPSSATRPTSSPPRVQRVSEQSTEYPYAVPITNPFLYPDLSAYRRNSCSNLDSASIKSENTSIETVHNSTPVDTESERAPTPSNNPFPSTSKFEDTNDQEQFFVSAPSSPIKDRKLETSKLQRITPHPHDNSHATDTNTDDLESDSGSDVQSIELLPSQTEAVQLLCDFYQLEYGNVEDLTRFPLLFAYTERGILDLSYLVAIILIEQDISDIVDLLFKRDNKIPKDTVDQITTYLTETEGITTDINLEIEQNFNNSNCITAISYATEISIFLSHVLLTCTKLIATTTNNSKLADFIKTESTLLEGIPKEDLEFLKDVHDFRQYKSMCDDTRYTTVTDANCLNYAAASIHNRFYGLTRSYQIEHIVTDQPTQVPLSAGNNIPPRQPRVGRPRRVDIVNNQNPNMQGQNLQNNPNMVNLLQTLNQFVQQTDASNQEALRDQRRRHLFPNTHFSGKPTEDARSHWTAFEKYAAQQVVYGNMDHVNRWPDTKRIFATTLTGTASTWLDANTNQATDFETLKRMFLQKYNKWGQTTRELSQAWAEIKFMPSTQTVEEYAQDCQTLGQMLEVNPGQVLQKFKSGFNPNIETQLLDSDTMQAAVAKAILLVSIYKSDSGAKSDNFQHQMIKPLQPEVAITEHVTTAEYEQDSQQNHYHNPTQINRGRGNQRSRNNFGQRGRGSNRPPRSNQGQTRPQYNDQQNHYQTDSSQRGQSQGNRSFRGRFPRNQRGSNRGFRGRGRGTPYQPHEQYQNYSQDEYYPQDNNYQQYGQRSNQAGYGQDPSYDQYDQATGQENKKKVYDPCIYCQRTNHASVNCRIKKQVFALANQFKTLSQQENQDDQYF